MRDEPQDLVQDLVTGILVKLRKHPGKAKDRSYCHKVLDWIWFDIFMDRVDPETGKTLKRGKQNKLAYKNVESEHQLKGADKRYHEVCTQGNSQKDPD